MGAIGRWIDEKCASEPGVMRRVLGRKFGDLRAFVDDEGKCGCLVGSWGIESGAIWAVQRAEFGHRIAQDETAYDVGSAVFDLTLRYIPGHDYRSMNRKRPDAFVIRFLKQRIRKALGLAPSRRETEVLAVGSGETPQP